MARAANLGAQRTDLWDLPSRTAPARATPTAAATLAPGGAIPAGRAAPPSRAAGELHGRLRVSSRPRLSWTTAERARRVLHRAPRHVQERPPTRGLPESALETKTVRTTPKGFVTPQFGIAEQAPRDFDPSIELGYVFVCEIAAREKYVLCTLDTTWCAGCGAKALLAGDVRHYYE